MNLKKYYKLDPDFILRQNILNALSIKYNDILFDGLNNKKILGDESHDKTAMMLPEITKKLGVKSEYILTQLTVLVSNKDISYVPKKGMILEDNGFVSVHNKKYLNEAEDILWKNRERMFNFVTKPVFLIISVSTLFLAIAGFYKNSAINKDLIKMESTIKILESKIFQLENSTPKKN
jgi:hypothetical protein